MKICFCNGKGGTGKTTLSVMIAHTLAESGNYRTGLLDRDPQKTASDWIREQDSSPVQLLEKNDSKEGYDAVIIDTPPHLESAAFRTSVQESDLVILVSSPSPADLKTSLSTSLIIQKYLKPGAKVRLVFNQVQPNTILGRNLGDMAEKLQITALKAFIQRRQAYQQAAVLGWRALDERSKSEVMEMALEVIGIAHRKS